MGAMDRRRIAWGVTLAITAAGGLVAHLLVYGLLTPHRDQAHHGTGAPAVHQGAHLRVCLAICLAVAAIGLLVSVLERADGRGRFFVPVWLFAAAPPFGFFLQEQLERALETGTLHAGAPLDAGFLLGLAVQIPFAVAAYLAARGLLALAGALVRRLGTLARPRLPATQPGWRPALVVAAPQLTLVRAGRGQRAPPFPL